MQPNPAYEQELQSYRPGDDTGPLLQPVPSEVAANNEVESSESDDSVGIRSTMARMHIGHTPPPRIRGLGTMESSNVARYTELLQKRRYRRGATRRLVHESLVCSNCYLAYQRSWVLSEWLLKNFVERLVVKEAADVKIRHRPGPSETTEDQPLPNRGMSAYDHEVTIWLSDRDMYAMKVCVRAWINQHRHQTLCPYVAVEVDWPVYLIPPSDIIELSEEAIEGFLKAWRTSDTGVITVDKWRGPRHIGQQFRLTTGTGLQLSDIAIAARHIRLEAYFTQPPRLTSEDRQALPVANPEITASPMITD
ncbi:hypothetical protein ACEPAH_5283 [Sanghuangporus vaninii]